MSLLNEMLNDLSKQQSLNQSRPSLTTALTQPENLKINRYLLGGAGIVLLLIMGVMIKHKMTVREPAIAKTTQTQVFIASEAVAQKSMKTIAAVQQSSNQTAKRNAPAKPLLSPVTNQKSTDEQMNEVVQALEDGHDKKAKAILQDILVKEPSAIHAREQLASLYLSYGDFANATKILNVGLEYAPEDPGLNTLKAKIYIGQGQVAEAIALLKSDHPSMVSYPEYYSTLAAALEVKGKVSEAGTYYKSLIKVDPSNGKYWLGYAMALEFDDKKDQAIMAYKRASQNPSSELSVRSYAQDRLKNLVG